MTDSKLHIPTSPQASLTLYDLLRMVRASLENRFSDPLWVNAEISELKLNRSGHCYLNLVEKGTGEGAPRASARAVIWRSAYEPIATMFERATGTPLSEGIKVLVRVVITYHEAYGFSLQIIDLDPSYTIGEVERRRRETISRLEADGVWDMNHDLPLPRPTLRLAVVSSATAAGYQDFVRELSRSPYRFSLTLFESLMQGDMAEDSVIAALGNIAAREEEFDAVVIIRGGGSRSDLALFDSYRIASHTAQFPLPIIAGIGHDKDISVVDMVAHTSCKTPTAVATTLVEWADVEATLLETISLEIEGIATRLLNDENLRIMQHSNELYALAKDVVHNHERHIQSLENAILSEATMLLSRESARLDSAARVVDSYQIDNILRLGFAALRSGERYITTAAGANIGESIEVELSDGVLSAEIRDIKLRN